MRRLLGAFVVGGFLVWWALDLGWTAFPTPFAQLASILADERAAARLLHTAPGASAPWQWLVDQAPYPFYTAGLRDPAGALVALRVSFQGAPNPFLILLAPVTLGYAGVLAWREGDRPALVAFCWAAAPPDLGLHGRIRLRLRPRLPLRRLPLLLTKRRGGSQPATNAS